MASTIQTLGCGFFPPEWRATTTTATSSAATLLWMLRSFHGRLVRFTSWHSFESSSTDGLSLVWPLQSRASGVFFFFLTAECRGGFYYNPAVTYTDTHRHTCDGLMLHYEDQSGIQFGILLSVQWTHATLCSVWLLLDVVKIKKRSVKILTVATSARRSTRCPDCTPTFCLGYMKQQ